MSARREQMMAGRRALDRGDFREAHEQWEAAWNESAGAERRWIQGMIQIATALLKLAEARPDLARSLLAKALAKLTDAPPARDAPPALDALDLPRLAVDAAALLAALERGESPSPAQLRVHDPSRR